MLVDSGSQVNIVSVNDCHPDVLSQLAPSPVEVSGYDGSPINIRGVFETDITIGGIKICKTQIFVTESKYKAVLGTPVLDQLVIDLPAQMLRKNGRVAKISKSATDIGAWNYSLQTTQGAKSHEKFQLFATSKTTINPFTEAIIPIQIQRNFRNNGHMRRNLKPAVCHIQ